MTFQMSEVVTQLSIGSFGHFWPPIDLSLDSQFSCEYWRTSLLRVLFNEVFLSAILNRL